jgi:hypothetical protein
LDECDHESQLALINQTFSKHSSKNSHSSIHILITSRPYPEIGQHLTKFNGKDLASYPEVKEDLQVFIREKVNDLSQKIKYPKELALEISQILEEKAKGTFMWVGIACGELTKIRFRCRDAVKTLEKLPRGLHSLHQELLDTALGKDKRTIIQMLNFVAISLRPLTVAELHIDIRSLPVMYTRTRMRKTASISPENILRYPASWSFRMASFTPYMNL